MGMRPRSPALLGVSLSPRVKRLNIMELDDGFRLVNDYFRAPDIDDKRKPSYRTHRDYSFFNDAGRNAVFPDPNGAIRRKRSPEADVRSALLQDYYRHLPSSLPSNILRVTTPCSQYDREVQSFLHHRDGEALLHRHSATYRRPCTLRAPPAQELNDDTSRMGFNLCVREYDRGDYPDSKSENCKLTEPKFEDSSSSSSDSPNSRKRSGSPSIHSPKKKWIHCYMAVGMPSLFNCMYITMMFVYTKLNPRK